MLAERDEMVATLKKSGQAADTEVDELRAKIERMNQENAEVEIQFQEWNASFEKERLTK